MDANSATALALPCPFHWYCNREIWHSPDDLIDHLTGTHAGAYCLNWAGTGIGSNTGNMRVSREKDGSLRCKLKGCCFANVSINSLLDHLKREHHVEATSDAEKIPTLPWPQSADDLCKWARKKTPKGVKPQGAPSNRLTHAVGQPFPQPLNCASAPRAPEMDQAGLPSAVSTRDDVPPPRISSAAPALSQRSETQVQQPSSSERIGPSLTPLEVLRNLRKTPSLLSKSPETQTQQPRSSQNTGFSRLATPSPRPHGSRSSQNTGSLRFTTPSSRFHGPFLDLETVSPWSKLRSSPLSRQPPPLSLHSQYSTERPCAPPSAPSTPLAPSLATDVLSPPQNESFSPTAPRLKRNHSPSPVRPTSKKARLNLESPPSPSVISRVASFMMSPLKSHSEAIGPTAPPPTPRTPSRSCAGTVPTSLKRQLSPSPNNKSNKRPRHEDSSSSPPFISRVVSLVTSPFKASSAARPTESQIHPSSSPIVSSQPPIPPQPSQGTTAAETDVNVLDTSELLAQCGLVFHTIERVLICTECQYGYLLRRALTHTCSKKRDKVSRTVRNMLFQEMTARGVVQEKADLREREFGSPPVEGIKFVPGYACDQCKKAWKTKSDAVDHCKERHDGNSAFYTECKIQSILNPQFKEGGVHWVRVVPGTSRDPADAFTAYHRTWGVEHRRRPNIIPGPVNNNGITLLARFTGWLDHLAPYIRTEDDVEGLRSLTNVADLPRYPHFALLPEVVREYSNQSCALVNTMDIDLRYRLTECPTTNQTDFFNLPLQSSINTYANTLTIFTFALLTSTDTNKTEYRFPFTEVQKSAVRKMQARLRANSNSAPADRTKAAKALVKDLHSLLRVFLIGLDGAERSKFDSVLECFLAIFAIQHRGILCKPDKVLSACTHMKLWTRLCIVFEADARLEEAPDLQFDKVFTDLAMKNLNPTVQSHFTRIAARGRLFTTLINRTVRPPNMRVSPDYLNFTYDLKTLHLPKLREVVPAAVDELKALLKKLEMGIEIPVTYPKVFKDDWTTEEAGDSFLRYNTFLDEDNPGPWIRGLFQSKTVGLASRSSDGSLRFDSKGRLLLNSHVVNDILDNDRDVVELAMVLGFITSSGGRGSEFAESRLENGDRPRSFLVDFDGECTLATRRLKTETITKKTTFIPSLVPREISEPLLKYIITIRPGINELVRMHCGEAAAVRQGEFLWASRGNVYDGDRLGKLLETFTSLRLEVEIGRRAWRQLITEIMRIYFNRNIFSENSEVQNIHDARMGRSSATSHAHYAINDARHMASDESIEFRAASLELHQVLGLGDAGKLPLIPCRLQRAPVHTAALEERDSTRVAIALEERDVARAALEKSNKELDVARAALEKCSKERDLAHREAASMKERI